MIKPEQQITLQRLLVPVLLALVMLRILVGHAWDPLIAASGAVFAIGISWQPGRGTWIWWALAMIALVQLLPLPVPGLPTARVPDWAMPVMEIGPPGRWSVAPWATLHYVMMFIGMAFWAQALQQRDVYMRRETGYQMRMFGVALALWALTQRLNGWPTDIGENHVAILMAMIAAEPILRLHKGGLLTALSVLVIGLGVISTGAMLPILLVLGMILFGPVRRGLSWSWRPLALVACACLVVALLSMVLTGLWSQPGIRLAVWHDALRLAGDAFPWGIGFGGFHWVFPAYVEHLPKPAMRALHSENAYLWLFIEGGLPALGAMLMLRGGHRRRGRAARAARWAMLLLALACVIETPLLWSPVLWLMPLFVAQGWTWESARLTATSEGA